MLVISGWRHCEKIVDIGTLRIGSELDWANLAEAKETDIKDWKGNQESALLQYTMEYSVCKNPATGLAARHNAAVLAGILSYIG